jgi:transcriptional regulator with XRE-family HTH domain
MKEHRFGSLLRKARVSARVTLQEAADALGVSVVYVSEVELTKRPPFSIPRIRQLATLYRVADRPLIEAALAERRYFEIQDPSPSKDQMRALSGMARGGLTDDQWKRIVDIVAPGEDENGE